MFSAEHKLLICFFFAFCFCFVLLLLFLILACVLSSLNPLKCATLTKDQQLLHLGPEELLS